MQTFGPFAMTAGTPTQVGIPQDTVSVSIKNRSPFDLFIIVQPGPPASRVQAGGFYLETVASGDRLNMVLPAAAYQQAQGTAPQSTALVNGVLWLVPNLAETQAQGGVTSLKNAVYVTAYQPGDIASEDSGSPEYIDVTSEGKEIALPIAATFPSTTIATFGAIGTLVSLPVGAFPAPQFVPGGAPGLLVSIYVHYLYVAIRSDNSGHMTVKLQVTVSNNVATVLHTFDLVQGTMANTPAGTAPAAMYPFIFAPPQPFTLVFRQANVGNTPYTIGFQLVGVEGTGSMTIVANMVTSVDVTSGIALPDIGAPSSQIGTPSGGGTGVY